VRQGFHSLGDRSKEGPRGSTAWDQGFWRGDVDTVGRIWYRVCTQRSEENMISKDRES
jgi:hypothetical protein